MRPAIVIDSGHLQFTLLFKKGPYFFIVHADLVPAVHLFFSPAMLRYCFRYHSVSPKACKLTIARTSSRDSQIVGALRSYTLRRSRNSSFWHDPKQSFGTDIRRRHERRKKETRDDLLRYT